MSILFFEHDKFHLKLIDSIILMLDFLFELNNLIPQPLNLKTHPSVDLPLVGQLLQ